MEILPVTNIVCIPGRQEGFWLERPFKKYLLLKKMAFFFLPNCKNTVTDQGNVRKCILKRISWHYFIRKSLISAKYNNNITIDGSAFPLHTCNTFSSIYEPLIPPYPHKKLWVQSWSEGAIGWPAERNETIIQEGAQRLGELATQAYILARLRHSGLILLTSGDTKCLMLPCLFKAASLLRFQVIPSSIKSSDLNRLLLFWTSSVSFSRKKRW